MQTDFYSLPNHFVESNTKNSNDNITAKSYLIRFVRGVFNTKKIYVESSNYNSFYFSFCREKGKNFMLSMHVLKIVFGNVESFCNRVSISVWT